jgi:hypothetical protein
MLRSRARADPLLKPPVAGLIQRVAVWQVRAWGAGSQDPQDAIEYGTVLPPRATATVFAARQCGGFEPAITRLSGVSLLIRRSTGLLAESRPVPRNDPDLARSSLQHYRLLSFA